MRREKLKVIAAESADPPGYVLGDQVGFIMRVALQAHTVIFTARMIEDLTQPQFAALAKLREVGPCSQNHLGRLIFLDAATIKGVIDRLTARGFVSAVADPKDRRRRALALTERGRAVTEEAIKASIEITAATLAPLTAEEQQEVKRLLRKMARMKSDSFGG